MTKPLTRQLLKRGKEWQRTLFQTAGREDSETDCHSRIRPILRKMSRSPVGRSPHAVPQEAADPIRL